MTNEDNIPDWQQTEPLEKITCTSSKCDEDLHCFLNSFRGKKLSDDNSYRSEVCISCGVKLVDWYRLDKRDINDVNYTIESFKKELFRKRYWSRHIDEELIIQVQEKSISEIEKEIEKRIRRYINKRNKDNPYDGRQTPLEGHLIFYAQHATGTCCKKCIEEWHGIKRNDLLTDKQISYLIKLIMIYIKKRLKSPSAEGYLEK